MQGSMKKNCDFQPISHFISEMIQDRPWRSGRTSVFDRRTFLSCAQPAADGWPLMWVNRPL